MTVHAAKGLEFPYVFLCGMNEGIFPSRKVRTQQAMEEERRLAFVALTRAEKGLYQTQLAELVGVSRNTISSIETGQFNPTAKLALVLCIALDKKFEDLFYF